MLETVTAYIERHRLLPASGELLVAVSGGADSLCLLHLLHRLCGPGRRYPRVQLRVAHLNHKLRAAAGAQDATYVAQLAANLGLPCTLGEVDVPALALNERRSLEDAARLARYRFLREAAHGSLIAVAHHADDQAETLLLHLLRGSGLPGMVGMQPRRHDIIRPLLAVSHAETVAYCQEHGLLPLEDLSNIDPHFLRNRVRHELLPLLATMNPAIRQTLLRQADVVRVDLDWIETQVAHYWPTVVIEQQEASITLRVSALLALPLSLQRHLLERGAALLCSGQSPLQSRHYALIEDALRTRATAERGLDLPGRLRATLHAQTLVLARLLDRPGTYAPQETFSAAPTDAHLPIPGRVPVSGTPWIASAQPLAEDVARAVGLALRRDDWPQVWRLLPSTRHTVYIDGNSVNASVWVRTRRPGDRIRPLGMEQEKKVQDVLVDKHISRSLRAAIPLFFSASHCLWIAGVQLDHRARLTCDTQRIVQLAIETAS